MKELPRVSLFYIGALVRDNREILFVDFGSMPQENNVTFSQLFEQGLASQQQKNWDAALDSYQQALDKGLKDMNPNQASAIYHNMSTVAFEKADFLKAYVWSKKAVALNPSNKIAGQSLEQHSKKFEVPQLAHQISSYENLKSALRLTSIDFLSILTLVLFSITLMFTFKNLILSKKNAVENLPRRGFSWVAFVLGLATFVTLFSTIILWNDELTLRGLIIADKTAVQTAPGENKPVIFEVQPGIEVEVIQSQADYVQVRYPGAFSGWIPKKSIEVLSIAQ
ncbi:MAG: hypothetical protein H7328_09365 [Bdellovibrio sp.]|nr:hypothetical protein [Bdellovibrio sp.]